MEVFYVLVKFIELEEFWITVTKHILQKVKIWMFEVKYLENYMLDIYLMWFMNLRRLCVTTSNTFTSRLLYIFSIGNHLYLDLTPFR